MRFYHNPRCSKSRQALALLEERGVEVEIVRYLEVGNRSTREDVHYPDDDMVMKRVAGEAPTFTRADGSPY